MDNDRADSAAFSDFAAELLRKGIQLRFQAKGRSMLPTINDGDLLYVESVNMLKFKVGDIVLCKVGREFKAHRIISKHGQTFVTRGDAGGEPDGEVELDRIVGKVVAKKSQGTGRLISLQGAGARACFFWRELRRLCRR